MGNEQIKADGTLGTGASNSGSSLATSRESLPSEKFRPKTIKLKKSRSIGGRISDSKYPLRAAYSKKKAGKLGSTPTTPDDSVPSSSSSHDSLLLGKKYSSQSKLNADVTFLVHDENGHENEHGDALPWKEKRSLSCNRDASTSITAHPGKSFCDETIIPQVFLSDFVSHIKSNSKRYEPSSGQECFASQDMVKWEIKHSDHDLYSERLEEEIENMAHMETDTGDNKEMKPVVNQSSDALLVGDEEDDDDDDDNGSIFSLEDIADDSDETMDPALKPAVSDSGMEGKVIPSLAECPIHDSAHAEIAQCKTFPSSTLAALVEEVPCHMTAKQEKIDGLKIRLQATNSGKRQAFKQERTSGTEAVRDDSQRCLTKVEQLNNHTLNLVRPVGEIHGIKEDCDLKKKSTHRLTELVMGNQGSNESLHIKERETILTSEDKNKGKLLSEDHNTVSSSLPEAIDGYKESKKIEEFSENNRIGIFSSATVEVEMPDGLGLLSNRAMGAEQSTKAKARVGQAAKEDMNDSLSYSHSPVTPQNDGVSGQASSAGISSTDTLSLFKDDIEHDVMLPQGTTTSSAIQTPHTLTSVDVTHGNQQTEPGSIASNTDLINQLEHANSLKNGSSQRCSSILEPQKELSHDQKQEAGAQPFHNGDVSYPDAQPYISNSLLYQDVVAYIGAANDSSTEFRLSSTGLPMEQDINSGNLTLKKTGEETSMTEYTLDLPMSAKTDDDILTLVEDLCALVESANGDRDAMMDLDTNIGIINDHNKNMVDQEAVTSGTAYLNSQEGNTVSSNSHTYDYVSGDAGQIDQAVHGGGLIIDETEIPGAPKHHADNFLSDSPQEDTLADCEDSVMGNQPPGKSKNRKMSAKQQKRGRAETERDTSDAVLAETDNTGNATVIGTVKEHTDDSKTQDEMAALVSPEPSDEVLSGGNTHDETTLQKQEIHETLENKEGIRPTNPNSEPEDRNYRDEDNLDGGNPVDIAEDTHVAVASNVSEDHRSEPRAADEQLEVGPDETDVDFEQELDEFADSLVHDIIKSQITLLGSTVEEEKSAGKFNQPGESYSISVTDEPVLCPHEPETVQSLESQDEFVIGGQESQEDSEMSEKQSINLREVLDTSGPNVDEAGQQTGSGSVNKKISDSESGSESEDSDLSDNSAQEITQLEEVEHSDEVSAPTALVQNVTECNTSDVSEETKIEKTEMAENDLPDGEVVEESGSEGDEFDFEDAEAEITEVGQGDEPEQDISEQKTSELVESAAGDDDGVKMIETETLTKAEDITLNEEVEAALDSDVEEFHFDNDDGDAAEGTVKAENNEEPMVTTAESQIITEDDAGNSPAKAEHTTLDEEAKPTSDSEGEDLDFDDDAEEESADAQNNEELMVTTAESQIITEDVAINSPAEAEHTTLHEEAKPTSDSEGEDFDFDDDDDDAEEETAEAENNDKPMVTTAESQIIAEDDAINSEDVAEARDETKTSESDTMAGTGDNDGSVTSQVDLSVLKNEDNGSADLDNKQSPEYIESIPEHTAYTEPQADEKSDTLDVTQTETATTDMMGNIESKAKDVVVPEVVPQTISTDSQEDKPDVQPSADSGASEEDRSVINTADKVEQGEISTEEKVSEAPATEENRLVISATDITDREGGVSPEETVTEVYDPEYTAADEAKRTKELVVKGEKLLQRKQKMEKEGLKWKVPQSEETSANYGGISASISLLSPRSSDESTSGSDLSVRELKDALAEMEEKYRQAMVHNAQLDNERAQLNYRVEQLKDSIEEQEDDLYRVKKEYKDKCQELERDKRLHEALQHKYADLQEALRQRDELIQEQGLVMVGGNGVVDGESDEEDGYGGERQYALVTPEAAQVLQSAGEGSLDNQLKHLAEEKQDLYDQLRRLKAELEEERRNNEGNVNSKSSSYTENGVADMQLLEIQREASKQISEYKFKLQKAEQEIGSFQANVTRLETQLQRYKATSEVLEKSEDEMRAEKRKLQRDLRAALDRIEEMEMTNAHLEKRLERMRASRSAQANQT